MHLDYLKQYYYEFYKSHTKQYYDKFYFFCFKIYKFKKIFIRM